MFCCLGQRNSFVLDKEVFVHENTAMCVRINKEVFNFNLLKKEEKNVNLVKKLKVFFFGNIVVSSDSILSIKGDHVKPNSQQHPSNLI